MKRSYISPEFNYTKVEGTFNMLEKKNFFGSKMLSITDTIFIGNTNIIYYQNNNKEQINENQEKLLDPYTYSPINSKKDNHNLIYDKSQSEFEKINNTKWILNINLKEILKNYIFAEIKKSRAFEGVRNSKTKDKSVNQAIFNYIENNLLDRYEFDKIDFYINYKSLLDNNSNNLQPNIENSDNIIYNSNISNENNLEKKVSYDIDYDEKFLKVNFRQSKIRSEFTFEYYFNINFKRV